MQSWKSSSCRVVQILRPVCCEPGCRKTDDMIDERQKLEIHLQFPVEEVLSAEMTNRLFQIWNSNSQIEMTVARYAL